MKQFWFDVVLGAFMREIIMFVLVKPVAKPFESRWSRFMHKMNPLVRQPFVHAWHHKGTLADCDLGLCKIFD